MVSNPSEFDQVLASAAKLQDIVPDLVLVGGTAAAIHAHHRVSRDHDHVLHDLALRYAAVVDAVESSAGWATSVRSSHPPLTLMGSLDGVQAGIRQLRRTLPVESEEWDLPSGGSIRVPTLEEILRIKAYLAVDRGAARDFLDVAALAVRLGIDQSVEVLRSIDRYYAVRSNEDAAVSTELAVKLANPRPIDPMVIDQLPFYRGLAPEWHEWSRVVEVCQDLARGLAKL